MQIASFHPRLTKAECEFWFDSGADWQEQTERQMETCLAQAFPDVRDIREPFLRFEPNYLAILSGPMGDAPAHKKVRAHADCITRALAAYQDAAQPRRVQTLFLNYQFEFDADILPCGPRKTVWKTPQERMTLEWDTAGAEAKTGLALRCLITHPPACCLTRSGDWLERIHHKMEGAFRALQWH